MKTALIWMAELAVAAFLMWIDMRLFWLYFFMTMIWLVNRRIGCLRKTVRFFQIANEMKLLAIATKVGVEAADIERQFDLFRENLTQKQRDEVEADLKEVTDTASRVAQD
jgi:hypothetical protein